MDAEGRSSLPRTFIRLNDLSGAGGGGGVEQSEVEPTTPTQDGASTAGEDASASGGETLPYPTMAPVVFFYLKQTTRPRSWCLQMVGWPSLRPLYELACVCFRCSAGIIMLEYSLNLQNVSFSAVRTVRVLRPLRAINRVPSMRILVTLLLDTLPMLGNVLLLCFFVFFIFGIVGVQLWAGLLRNRCFVEDNFSFPLSLELGKYFHTENDDENPFICSQQRENGMRECGMVPVLYEEGGLQCRLDMDAYNSTDNTTCVNWNQYYTNCSAGLVNPFKGAINFDNICYAWIAIFQVITLEGWVDIMYFVMDAHSFYNFIYFILLIIIGSFFMINLCLVVIATQFSETKQRESQLMKEQRVRFLSNASTLASFSEPGSCYDELLKFIVHVVRKGAKQGAHVARALLRRAGVRIAATPPPPEPQGRQRRRRKASRQGSVSAPQPAPHQSHHHHHHPHHHHCHLGNGSARHTAGARGPHGAGLASWDLEAGSRGGDGGGSGGRLSLAPPPCRNSVPFAGPGQKNYPTLQATALAEARRGSAAAHIHYGLNIPAGTPDRRPSMLDLLTSRDLSSASSGPGAAGLTTTFDPEGCPYCAKALALGGDPDGGFDDSDSEGVYEFTQDLHHRDGRDGRQSGPRGRGPGLTAARVVRFWRLVCDTFRKIVDSKYFGRGIMIAILINTLSMGIEYHEQPDELTNALEISNIVFTSLFALEMLLKVLVYGPFGYIKNPYNIFDGIIVVISVWEIVGQQGGGLSVLRTFRLMRVLKLVRFMPALQRQLVVLMKTMDNVATFCMLLMLFIFIFSILGMHLFGCKFGSERDGDTLPDRKNFDSLLWAIVTVFQILTQEDWNKVLYNGMASTRPVAALYFIALMTFGNYVLFNLLVAILVEGFQTEVMHRHTGTNTHTRTDDLVPINGHVDLKTSLTPPLITHTAATPMPVPRLPAAGDPVLGYESRRASSVSAEPAGYDRSPSSARSAPWASVGGSRRSSWNSLGRAPSLKRQKRQSGERRSLLSGEGGSSSDEGEGHAGGVRSMEEEDDNNNDHNNDNNDNNQDNVSLARTDSMSGLFGWLERKQPEWCRQRASWAIYIFPPENRFRIVCNRIIGHKMFDHIVLAIIFLNCITIAMERPRIEPASAERIILTLSNYIFTAIFVTEMTVKIVALGWCFGDKAYLRSSWNLLDGMLVMISVIDILVSLISNSGTKILGMLRVLRLLRTLRPLRVISRAPGLKLVVETLMSSLKPIGNIVVICCAFFIIFGILGVQLFKGKFFVCQGEDVRNITNRSDCQLASYKWVRHKYNFDNLGQALMSLFVLASKDGWVDIMYDGLDAVGVDKQPVMNNNPWMLLYFISFLLIVAFFVLNMFVGVVVENFHKCRRSQEAEEAKIREEKRLKRMEKKRRMVAEGKAQSKPYYSDYSPTRLLIHKMCISQYLDLFITIVIGLNVITMSMEHYQQPRELDEALKICNYIFTLIFVMESVMKLVAFGFRRFFKDRWNQLDLAIVLLSIMGIVLEEIEVNASLPINPTIIRIMRVLRIARVLKLLKMAVGMRALLDTVMQALPQLHPCEGLGRYATFRNFGMAFLLLFRVSTGDNWNGIMKDTLRDCAQETGTCYNTVVSPLYFVSFVLTAQFVLVNVVIAVLMKHLEESNKEAKEEAEMEAEMELELQGEGCSSAAAQEVDQQGVPEDHLLSVRKCVVGRTHSLPNDSYMFPPPEAPGALPVLGPKHTDVPRGPRLGNMRWLSPCVADSGVASDSGRRPAATGIVTPPPSADPPAPPVCPSPSPHPLRRQQPALRLVPASPCAGPRPPGGASPSPLPPVSPPRLLAPPSPPRQQRRPRGEAAETDREVSFITRGPWAPWGPGGHWGPGGARGRGARGSSTEEDPGAPRAERPLKRFHSAEAHGHAPPRPRPRPASWLDDPRRHTVEACPMAAAAFGLGPAPPKKTSPPCISVDPPDGAPPPSALGPGPPPLPRRDACHLRRRGPSSDSKDSFDLGAGEGCGGPGPEPPDPPGTNTNPKLLTLPSFSLEKNAEH
uniref:Voltage-dependent T-type calcium channel subunit alpha n=1 Tax=Gadus morhua TaxID=8049 RepID=A0A8C5AKY7_GADMO